MKRGLCAVVLGVTLGLFALGPAALAAPSRAPAKAPAPSPATRAIPTQRPVIPDRSSTRTQPGIGAPATHGAISSRLVQGAILLWLAVAIVAWLARARVQTWMLGLRGR